MRWGGTGSEQRNNRACGNKSGYFRCGIKTEGEKRMFVAVIALAICLIFTLAKLWQKYCLYMGLMVYIIKNKLPEPTVEEMHEHISYVAKKTIEDLFRKS